MRGRASAHHRCGAAAFVAAGAFLYFKVKIQHMLKRSPFLLRRASAYILLGLPLAPHTRRVQPTSPRTMSLDVIETPRVERTKRSATIPHPTSEDDHAKLEPWTATRWGGRMLLTRARRPGRVEACWRRLRSSLRGLPTLYRHIPLCPFPSSRLMCARRG